MLLFLKNILFTVLVPGMVAVYIPLQLIADRTQPVESNRGVMQVIGVLLLAIGAAIYFWCLWDFAVGGRGTPAPIDAPKHLVVRGLYKYLRNPMYVGVLLVIAGWAVFLESKFVLIYGAILALFFHLFVRLVEEPLLRRKFGESYLNYCREVGRWLPKTGHKRATN